MVFQRRSKWWAKVRWTGGEVRTSAGREKRLAQSLERRLWRLVECARTGTQPERDQREWLATCEPSLRTKIDKAGLLPEGLRTAAAVSNLDGLVSEYLAGLEASDRTPGYVGQQRQRLTTTLQGMRAQRLADLTKERLRLWLAEQRRGNARFGIKSCNHYQRAVQGFTRWLWLSGRADADALQGMKPLNARADVRVDRRPFTDVELALLLNHVKSDETASKMNGTDRYWVYRLGAEAALRKGEIQSLTVASFDLNGTRPSVRVEARDSKNRRTASVPLSREFAAGLKAYLGLKLPNAHAFNMLTADAVTRALRRDIAAARAAWIAEADGREREDREQSDTLKPFDAKGQRLDFHSLRHTAVTNWMRTVGNPKVVARLARLQSIELLNRYAHALDDDLVAAVNGTKVG